MSVADLEVGAVWAPRASSVELVVDGVPHPLRAGPGGVWRSPAEHRVPIVAGARYGFRLDGGDVLPDPRSRWQPDGPLGLSAVDDADAFAWTDEGFEARPWPQAVVYELHLGTFSAEGTFRGAVAHLDHLTELGITYVELMPVGAWVGEWGWGYDGVCWWAPHPALGSPDDLRALVDACHGRGLAVLLDVVFNHLGPEGAVLDEFAPYTRPAETPWGRAVDLDSPAARPVRDDLVDCCERWVRDAHLDGLRLDAVHALEDRSDRHVVAELTARLDELSVDLGRDVVVVAEWDRHDPAPVVDRRRGGWGCRAQWADDLHHALHVTLTGERDGYYADAAASPDPIAEALDAVYLPRRATGDPAQEGTAAGISRSAFVVCLQNHDQVGNRAAGERITSLAHPDAVMAAVPLVLLGPSVPLVFQGEEWATRAPFPFFADHQGELAAQVRRGRLAEFPDHDPDEVADPGSRATFESARLRWDELDRPDHRAVLAWYGELIGLRQERFELWAGAPSRRCTSTGSSRVVVLERGRLRIACNLGDAPWGDGSIGPARLVVAWGDASVDGGRLALGPRSAAVLELVTGPIDDRASVAGSSGGSGTPDADRPAGPAPAPRAR